MGFISIETYGNSIGIARLDGVLDAVVLIRVVDEVDLAELGLAIERVVRSLQIQLGAV
jgi:hypothetical protein